MVMRARTEIEHTASGRECIVITEIPYMINKAEMIKKIADLINEKKIEGISYINDESDRNGMRIIVILKHDAVASVVLNTLYKNTPLQTSFAVNNIALVNGRPMMLNLLDLVRHFVEHRHDVIVRRTRFDLAKAEKRLHIVLGLLIAQDNIDEIIEASYGIMVARGDLGVEIDFTELPGIQKSVIDRSFSFGKPIVTATQMLDSMMVNPRPTRAEISDVANAIYDGTSAIMLSGETAAGAYPVDALKTMSAIAERTEQEGFHLRGRMMDSNPGKISVSDATAHAACLTARDVNAAAIVTVSESGTTARLLSKYRPQQPIIACVMREQVQRQLSLSWGITPLMMSLAHSTDELIEMSTALAKENGYLHNGELAVVTAGVPVGVSGTTNMIKIHMVGNCLATGVGVGPENNDVASGKACVCRTMDEVRAKFKPGMVLVVPSTSNEMLSFVRDAAALVVEEPGLNSHAAIAGKALLKPTVVGAAGATSHIRDGLMVAVDCAHGSVQRLQA